MDIGTDTLSPPHPPPLSSPLSPFSLPPSFLFLVSPASPEYNYIYLLFVFLCRERIGNFKVEPPGLFRGRGDHPKQGRIKVCLSQCWVISQSHVVPVV